MSKLMQVRASLIVSVYHHRLFCTMDEIYMFLNYLTGQKIFTSSLPAAFDDVHTHLGEQFPWLADVFPPPPKQHAPETYLEFARILDATYGTSIPVHPLPPDDVNERDPMKDFHDRKPDALIVTIVDDDE